VRSVSSIGRANRDQQAAVNSEPLCSHQPRGMMVMSINYLNLLYKIGPRQSTSYALGSDDE
jgi:hypothetical protein